MMPLFEKFAANARRICCRRGQLKNVRLITAAKLINNCLNKFLLMTCVPSRRDETLNSITTAEVTNVSPAGTNTLVVCTLAKTKRWLYNKRV